MYIVILLRWLSYIIPRSLFIRADFEYTAICGGDGLKELCNEVRMSVWQAMHCECNRSIEGWAEPLFTASSTELTVKVNSQARLVWFLSEQFVNTSLTIQPPPQHYTHPTVFGTIAR